MIGTSNSPHYGATRNVKAGWANLDDCRGTESPARAIVASARRLAAHGTVLACPEPGPVSAPRKKVPAGTREALPNAGSAGLLTARECPPRRSMHSLRQAPSNKMRDLDHTMFRNNVGSVGCAKAPLRYSPNKQSFVAPCARGRIEFTAEEPRGHGAHANENRLRAASELRAFAHPTNRAGASVRRPRRLR
jgi:hypothetical protein